MDPALWELLRAEAGTDGDRVLEAVIRLARPGIEIPDVRIVSRFGAIATCRIRARDVIAVRARRDVISLKAPRVLSPGFEPPVTPPDLASPTLPDVRPTDVRRSPELGLTGEGVVVAAVDWGVDIDSAAFQWPADELTANGSRAAGATRFLSFWDQRDLALGPRPEPYGYGSVHSRDEIDRALGDPRPYERLGYHPAVADPRGRGSHGTRTMDIAAGNGEANGPAGIAPDADLIFVHLADRNTGGLANFGDSVRMLEAVDFICRTAGSQPCVINISAGRLCGPRDGTTLVERAFDELLATTPGRYIVDSAGNYFRWRAHSCGSIEAGETLSLAVVVDPADITLNEVEIWYDGADEFAVRIDPPGYAGGRPVRLGERSDILVAGRVAGRVYHRAHDPNNGANHIVAYLDPIGCAGNWTITLEGRRVSSGRFHAWIERDDSCRHCQARFAADDSNPSTTIGSIATSHLPLVVGAYDGHDPDRPVARFSSAGPSTDGRGKPDLVAPGVGVLAARSAPVGASRNSGLLVRGNGTSFATPHVTGAVALCFEAAGDRLSALQIRSLVLDSCDPVPGTDPDCRLGQGYLNIPRLLADLRQALGEPEVKEPTMDTEDILVLAAAPAVAYREYLYRPDGQFARWISDRFEVVGRPGHRLDRRPRPGDVLLEVTLGRVGPGRCATLGPADPQIVAARPRLSPGQLLLRPLQRVEMSEPLPVEPVPETADLAFLTPASPAAQESRDAETVPRRGDETSEAIEEGGTADESGGLQDYEASEEYEAIEEYEAFEGSEDLEAQDVREGDSMTGGAAADEPPIPVRRRLTTAQLREAWAEYLCAERAMVTIPLLSNPTPVNPVAEEAFNVLAGALRATGYQARSAWAYNCRDIAQASSGQPPRASLHAYGLAVDIDPDWNPHCHGVSGPIIFSSQPSQQERQQEVAAGVAGTVFTPGQVAAVEAIRTVDGLQVFRWGGRWRSSHDAMHFEIGLTPAELRRGIAARARREGEAEAYPEHATCTGCEADAEGDELTGKSGDAPAWEDAGGRLPWDLYDQLRLAPNPPPVIEAAEPAEVVDRSGPGYIRWYQDALNRLDGAGIAVDGIVGPLTRGAVRRFQQRTGLVVDGIVGPQTEYTLMLQGASPPPGYSGPPLPGPPPSPIPSSPATPSPGIDVNRAIAANALYAVQLGWGSQYAQILALLGLDTSATPDGFTGAVANWQQSSGLVVDGIIGPNTWSQMQPLLRPGEDLTEAITPVTSLTSPRFAGDTDLDAVAKGTLRLAAPGTSPYPAPVLSSGPAITKVQQALIDLGYPLPKFGADSRFGGETAAAVARYKTDRSITPSDSVVGRLTMASLDTDIVARDGPPPPPPPVDSVVRWTRLLGPACREGNDVVELVDGPEAFRSMHAAIRTAVNPEHYIYLLGWWLDLDEPLDVPTGGTACPSAPRGGASTIRSSFTAASAAGVQIRVMLWDQPGTKNTAEVAFVNGLANGAAILDNHQLGFVTGFLVGAQHQKMLVVKGTEGLIAFCGGVDINCDRICPPGACRPSGGGGTVVASSGGSGSNPGQPLHDVHCRIAGPAAIDLLRVFAKRWFSNRSHAQLDRAKGPLRGLAEPLPRPAGRAVVRIGETYNADATLPSGTTLHLPGGKTTFRDRTVQEILLTVIGGAQRFLYIEDQYLINLCAAEAIRRALPRLDHVTILIAASEISDMPQRWVLRKRFIDHIHTSAHAHKLRVFTLCTPGPPGRSPSHGPHTYVHAKMMIADDEVAVIGSANMNRRGWEHDAEAVAAVIGPGRDGALVAQKLRTRLWAEHLGVPEAAVANPITSKALWRAGPGSRVCPYNPTADTDPIKDFLIPGGVEVIDPAMKLASAPCCRVHAPSCPGARTPREAAPSREHELLRSADVIPG